MTTLSNPSPFSTDIKSSGVPTNLPTEQQGDFQIRTMKDDLAQIQGKGIVEEKFTKATAAPFESVPPLEPKEEPIKFNSSATAPENINPFAEQTFNPSENIQKIVEVPTETISINNKPASFKIIITIIIILVIAIISLGAYYFLLTKKAEPLSTITQPPIETPAPIAASTPEPTPTDQTPAIIETPAPKYSQDKPNYLPIDISTLNSEEIKTAFVNVSAELSSTAMNSPYEFTVVDANNNPIAFPIFATAAKFNLSPSLLSSLGNDFSVYFYNDNSKPRLGLSVQVSKKDILSAELIKQEKTFPIDASFLFLNNQPEIKTGVFANSPYKNYSVRFLNLNASKDLSIDFVSTETKFVIATSKDTERAILDKLDSEKLSSRKEITPTNIQPLKNTDTATITTTISTDVTNR